MVSNFLYYPINYSLIGKLYTELTTNWLSSRRFITLLVNKFQVSKSRRVMLGLHWSALSQFKYIKMGCWYINGMCWRVEQWPDQPDMPPSQLKLSVVMLAIPAINPGPTTVLKCAPCSDTLLRGEKIGM